MSLRKNLIFICATFVFVEAKWHNIQKREATGVCDPVYNNTNKVQCYCVKDSREPNVIRSADCYLTAEDVKPDDESWERFDLLQNAHKITLTKNRGITLKYIPTNALKHVKALLKLDIKYANVTKIQPYAFSNLSFVQEITLRDNQIQALAGNAFSHHTDLTEINLDTNNIVEINRDVFIDLPSLEKLFLTNNKITTIHDRAFTHLINLRELEINMNSLFSLNSETFSGLRKLLKLDLSNNNLEVIGDNTFLPLSNLNSVNLEGNKIQMLDEKAFSGLSKLQSLSLAHNKLSTIDSVNVFKGLHSLMSLSLRANGIRELKTQVMSPILVNFYAVNSNLDVEDNNFPCECHLDWFMILMNRTQSKNLKLAIENLKCLPDMKLREMWSKIEETDKNTGQIFDEDESSVQAADYEYYDVAQLNGKLFYTDVRDLINCSKVSGVTSPKKPDITTVKSAAKKDILTKVTTSPEAKLITTKPKVLETKTTTMSTKPLYSSTAQHNDKVPNHGLLDLSMYDSTPKTIDAKKEIKNDSNEIRTDKKQDSYTTSRLATVSAKPIENVNFYEDMASDEAKPDKLKAHRSVQDEFTYKHSTGKAHNNVGCVSLLIAMLTYRLLN